MNRSWCRIAVAAALGVLIALPSWAGGRKVEKGKRMRLMVSVGEGSPIEGGVEETFRPVNELRENPDSPESYTFAELGLDESDETLGLKLEYQWKWVTLFIDGTYLDATATMAAPDDLFIGVEEVFFEGQKFEYQQIPQGTVYDGEIDLLALNTRFGITPWHVNAGGNTEFVPWFVVGLFTLAGQFEVDAGPAQGVILYEFPPREYVVGGRSEGEAAAVAPEIGLGGEVTWRLGERARLTWQSNYTLFEFAGSTSDFGVSSRNEKDIDLDYKAFDTELFFELPMGNRSHFVAGIEFRRVEIDALSEAQDRAVEEVLERREKFNKDIDFSIESVLVNVGLRW
ncbi:MAG: hypothetical protein R3244_12025 [Thermoanaerobaculia bacterium]|nr:hypothetical protein [Thermoanaerobaculia bacterium]